jgi:hypothetical protein
LLDTSTLIPGVHPIASKEAIRASLKSTSDT